MRLLSKGDFAREVGISPGRVSQLIAEGKIGPDALEGEGRSARIRVDAALEQMRLRRDVGQSLGNGLNTKVFVAAPAESPATGDGPGFAPPRTDDVAYQIQLERLRSERRKNELAAVDDAVRHGGLVPADDVRQRMLRLARQVDDANAAMLADFASAVAGRFGLPQRDVLHRLREVRAEKKAAAAAVAREAAAALPSTVEFAVAAEAAAA
jgi:hypothetical protein